MNTSRFTVEQAQKLRDVLQENPLEAIITLALHTGMRRDELLSLQWQHLDLERGILRVQSTKKQHGLRIIPLLATDVELLKQHRMHQLEAQLEVGTNWQNLDLDLVFPDHVGGQLRPHPFLKEFDAVLTHLGFLHIRFHDLRLLVGQRLYKQFCETREEHSGVQDGGLDERQ